MKVNRTEEEQKAIDKRVPIDEFMTSEIRKCCRAGFHLCTTRLVSIGTGEAPDTTPFASVRAIDILGKYSMGKTPQNVFLDGAEYLGIICEIVAKHLGTGDGYQAFADDLRATVEQMI